MILTPVYTHSPHSHPRSSPSTCNNARVLTLTWPRALALDEGGRTATRKSKMRPSISKQLGEPNTEDQNMESASTSPPSPDAIAILPLLLLPSSCVFWSISSFSRPASTSLSAESARSARRVAYRMLSHTVAVPPPLGWASRNQLKTETSVASFFSRCKALFAPPSHDCPVRP